MAFANTMASNLAAARRAMRSDKAYRGTGVSTPRRAPIFGGNQRKGGQGNIRRVSRQPGIAEANIRPRAGGIWNTAKARGSKFIHPALDIMRRIGGGVEGAIRGSRLHKSYMDELGRAKGHEAWKDAKMKMMTDKEKAGYDKYMNLASMTDDTDKKQYYLDQAETSWRNKQTSDRLAAVMGFEDYDKSPDADKYFVEQTDYRGNPIPGLGRLKEVLQQFAPQEEGPIISPHLDPDMDITADLTSGIDYNAMGLEPDPENDLLYGEPGNMGNRIIPKPKPRPEDFYNYPDEDQLAPYDPWADIYDFERQRQKAYFTPKLLDEDRVHSTLPLGPRTLTSAPGEVTYPYGENLLDQPRTWNPGSAEALKARGVKSYLPNISVEFGDDPITPNITDINYFNQFMKDPGEEEEINPAWSKNKSPGRWGKSYNQYR